MVKSFYINIVIVVTALITTIGTAPVLDDNAFIEAARKMRKSATDAVSNRKMALFRTSRDSSNDYSDMSYIRAHIAITRSRSVPSLSPFTEQQLFQEPEESMRPSQLRFTRAYHYLVFEKLKTLFLKIEHHVTKHQNSEISKKGLDSVATHLLWSHDLAETCGERLLGLSTEKGPQWRKLELPPYDWKRVHSILLPALKRFAHHQLQIRNDVTTGEMFERLWNRVENVIVGRDEVIFRGLPSNLHDVLDPSPHVAAAIAWIRSDARPSTLTAEQLLETPNASMPEGQLHLTRAYHFLVLEKLKTLFMTIKYHINAHGNEERLEQALSEVGGALGIHQNLGNEYREILERIPNKYIVQHKKLKLPKYDWPPLDNILSMQSLPEGQNSVYNYEPISNHGLGCGLEASTSQPRPQPVLIDFLGVADMTWEATPELAPPFGHSREDRDPLPDDRFSNELRRHPEDHVGFVGGSNMHLRPSTDAMKRSCDSSLYGHTTTSNTRVAGSPQTNTRVRLFGQWFDST
ncbi:hypothetical protein SeLEV6574_g07841 [Synchytrium endobioticum]|uniref:Uncharacterized protein n=2 Tax=Synchytrium endobioticum TaxID=286115 RepID=A0A507CJA8_9FUNG|nr:hypothetical protein SeLEV6574_g07841 [Synchytrium endobioticum]